MNNEDLQNELDKLEQSINALKQTHSRLALMYIHESLRLRMEKSKHCFCKRELNQAIQGMMQFTRCIKAIQEQGPMTKDDIEIAYTKLMNEYKMLSRIIRGNKIIVFLKDSLHLILAGLGLALGCALGFLFAPIMVGVGLAHGYKKHGLWNAVQGIHRYYLNGFLQGMILSKRMLTSLENTYDRQMRFGLIYFESLMPFFKQLMDEEYIETIKTRILTRFLGEGYSENLRQEFLQKNHLYKLITMQAQLFSPNLQGSLGHHATIVYSSPKEDGTFEHHVIEMGYPSDEEIRIIEEDARTPNPDQRVVNQRQERQCDGQALLDMFVVHELVKNKYSDGFRNFPKPDGFRAGYNDCHTYVDLILASVKLPLSSVLRVTPKENWVGRSYCGLLNQFSIFPKQPRMGHSPLDEPIGGFQYPALSPLS